MFKMIISLLSLVSLLVSCNARDEPADPRAILYDVSLSGSPVPEIVLNGTGEYTGDGLRITGKEDVAKLDIFYALAERMVRYKVRFAADSKVIFRSSLGDFSARVNLPEKSLSMSTYPETKTIVAFLQPDRDYFVEIYHIYQQAKVRIIDSQTGEEAEISAVNDGTGGCGAGTVQPGYGVGMQWDHYCFGLESGSFLLVKQITVYALKKRVKLLMYGASISQPEAYFPTRDFPQSWTQQVIARLGGSAMSSGRGGATIDMVSEYIRNELPFIDTEYVMVTIGTNGGNTEENLGEIVRYIQSQGAIPILNNIPCNESGTQVENNILIEKVRQAYGLKGCKFDWSTSLNGDGQEVNRSTMYWEDYTGSYGWQIYHHPNEIGGKKMFEQTLVDLPELFE